MNDQLRAAAEEAEEPNYGEHQDHDDHHDDPSDHGYHAANDTRVRLGANELGRRRRGPDDRSPHTISLQGGYEGWLGLLANDMTFCGRRVGTGDGRQGPRGRPTGGTGARRHPPEVRYRQGRYDEASRLVGRARQSDLLEPYSSTISRSVEAKIRARQRRFSEALAKAYRAAEIAGATDQVELQGDVQLDLAEILRLAGKVEDSVACLSAAVDLYERKGNFVMASRARSFLDENETRGD
jgi:tetratricopeptide (TPR) repeat protein